MLVAQVQLLYSRGMYKARALSMLLGLCLCVSSNVTFADNSSQYKVEIIVFQNLAQQRLELEKWPSYPALPELKGAIELTPGDTKNDNKASFQLLPPSQMSLLNAEKRLGEDANIKVLLHYAWLQDIDAPENAKPIHLYSGPFNQRTESANRFTELPYDTAEHWQLNGTITLSKSKYINLSTDLLLNIPTADLPRNNTQENSDVLNRQIANFTMVQTRKLRSNELHYLDNPMLGVLIKVTPA